MKIPLVVIQGGFYFDTILQISNLIIRFIYYINAYKFTIQNIIEWEYIKEMKI